MAQWVLSFKPSHGRTSSDYLYCLWNSFSLFFDLHGTVPDAVFFSGADKRSIALARFDLENVRYCPLDDHRCPINERFIVVVSYNYVENALARALLKEVL
jgi:hypothetical protein